MIDNYALQVQTQLWVDAQHDWYDVSMYVNDKSDITYLKVCRKNVPQSEQDTNNIACLHEYIDVKTAAIEWIYNRGLK
jgi:hypothetical protein